jgi:hypothetical protein
MRSEVEEVCSPELAREEDEVLLQEALSLDVIWTT